MRGFYGAAVLAMAVAVLPVRADPDLDAGRAAYRAGDFRHAVRKLDQAQRSPALTENELLELHWARALVCTALSDNACVTESIDRLLDLRPLYEPDPLEMPPNLRATFHQRAAVWQQTHPVHMALPHIDGSRLQVEVQGELSRVAVVRLYARAPGDPAYTQVDLALTGGRAEGRLTARDAWTRAGQAGRFEIVVEALNVRGIPVNRMGDALHPQELTVSIEESRVALAELDEATRAAEPPAIPAPAPAAVTPPVAPAVTDTPAPAAADEDEDVDESPAGPIRPLTAAFLGTALFLGNLVPCFAFTTSVASLVIGMALAISGLGAGCMLGCPAGACVGAGIAVPLSATLAWIVNAWKGARRVSLAAFLSLVTAPTALLGALGGFVGGVIIVVGLAVVLVSSITSIAAGRPTFDGITDGPALALTLLGAAVVVGALGTGLFGSTLLVPVVLMFAGRDRAAGEDDFALDLVTVPAARPATTTPPAGH